MGKSRRDSESKADRKFEKKLQFYAKVRDTVASLIPLKSITKKMKLQTRQNNLKAYDLSSLKEFLPELNAPKQPSPAAEFKLNCKSRQKLMLKEAKQLNTVLDHPALRSDPFEAIHQHLLDTQPIVDDKSKKKSSKSGGKKVKDKKSEICFEELRQLESLPEYKTSVTRPIDETNIFVPAINEPTKQQIYILGSVARAYMPGMMSDSGTSTGTNTHFNPSVHPKVIEMEDRIRVLRDELEREREKRKRENEEWARIQDERRRTERAELLVDVARIMRCSIDDLSSLMQSFKPQDPPPLSSNPPGLI